MVEHTSSAALAYIEPGSSIEGIRANQRHECARRMQDLLTF